MKNFILLLILFTGITVFAQETKNVEKEQKALEIFELQQQPEYPGGIKAVLQYIVENFRLPSDYKGEKGKIMVQFIIEKNGEINEVEILQGVSPSLDAEAIRVIKSMKGWKAGMHNGAPARVRYVIPIKI